MKAKTSILVFLSALVFLTASCSGEEETPAPTPTPTPAQYLEDASRAMAEVESVQFSLTRDGAPLVLDSSLGAVFVSATGEYEAPDRVHASVKADISGNIISLDFLWLPEGIYMTNPLTGQYMKQPMEVPLDPGKLFDPQVGLSRILISRIEEPDFIGFEEMEGQDTVHLRAKTDAETVTIILPVELSGEFVLDLWLDSSTSEVIRIQITEENGDATTLDLLGYGEPVTIPAP